MLLVRRLAAAAAIAALAAACSPEEVSDAIDDVITAPDEPPAADGGGDDAPQDTGAEPGTDEDDAQDTGEEPAPPADEAPTEQPPADEPAEEPAEQPAQEQSQRTPLVDGGQVGVNAAAYVRGDRTRVVIEVDVQDGASLPGSVLEHVRSVLDRESDSAVELVTGTAELPQRDAWTAGQLREAAARTRDVAHSDDTAVIHLLVLAGGFEQDGVLGVAFDSSTAAVFPDQWSGLTGLVLSNDRVARAVTTHEVGHLLGLVGITTPTVEDHEDGEHPGHTTDEDDVMYWAVETDLIGSLDGVPDDFGPLTRADLAALRDG